MRSPCALAWGFLVSAASLFWFSRKPCSFSSLQTPYHVNSSCPWSVFWPRFLGAQTFPLHIDSHRPVPHLMAVVSSPAGLGRGRRTHRDAHTSLPLRKTVQLWGGRYPGGPFNFVGEMREPQRVQWPVQGLLVNKGPGLNAIHSPGWLLSHAPTDFLDFFQIRVLEGTLDITWPTHSPAGASFLLWFRGCPENSSVDLVTAPYVRRFVFRSNLTPSH